MDDLKHDLDLVALGVFTAEQAQKTVAAALRTGDELWFRRLYTALRAWTWKTMAERRRDDELRLWYNVLRGVSACLSDKNPALSERIVALYELLYESISIAEFDLVADRLSRAPGRAIIRTLADGRREDVAISEAVGIGRENVTLHVSPLVFEGLVARTIDQRGVFYELTHHGRAILADLPSESSKEGA